MKIICVLASLVASASISVADPLTSVFTWHGVLNETGVAANGVYDFEFRLYDAVAAGSALGSVQTAADVPVNRGAFLVHLDFGDVFDGNRRWMEIAVRPRASAGPYTTMTPRTELTATPHALFAKETERARTAERVSWTDIAGLPADFADGVDNGTAYSAGSGLILTGNIFSVAFTTNGAADTAARSDHGHFGAAWTGDRPNGSGLFVGNAGVDGRAVQGQADATTGNGIGVVGVSRAEDGTGVMGVSTGTGSRKAGVLGQVYGTGFGLYGSGDGAESVGAYGEHGAGTGTSAGVHGVTRSSDGNAVGVLGEVARIDAGAFSAAVRGINSGTGGSGIGVWGSQDGGGWGVYGTATWGTGVYGKASASGGTAIHAYGPGTSGTALAVENGAIRVAGAGIDASTPAFVHVVASSTTLSTIDHPLCNFDPNALLIVTPVSQENPPQAKAAGVTYNSNTARWQLFPTDPAGAFPAAQRFNILIIKP